MSSLDSLSSFSSVSFFELPSACDVSSCVALCTRFFTSDFILDTYKRATVNSSSTLPSALA